MNIVLNKNTAYVIGVSIGDGNLSCSNNRAVRLRITCDNKYPGIRENIIKSLKRMLPNNKVSEYVRKSNCVDVYCYSNLLESVLGWKAKGGSKYIQKISVPSWILNNDSYIKYCLRGLIETDGSVYSDRKYTYVNFTTIIETLKIDVVMMINKLGYSCTTNKVMQKSGKFKFIIRVCKNSNKFIEDLKISKS